MAPPEALNKHRTTVPELVLPQDWEIKLGKGWSTKAKAGMCEK